MVAWVGPAISAGASLLGGWMNSKATDKANAANLAASQANADRQIQLQKKFAQEGIRWRVEDAKKAGIHPLYALGASTPSYTPVSASFAQTPNTSMGAAMASAGQDIGRAINATRTGGERSSAFDDTVRKFTIENMQLDTEIKRATLASSIQRLNQQGNPPIPADSATGIVPEAKKVDDRPIGYVGGTRVWTDPNTSNVDDFWQKRYGEPGEWVGAAVTAWQDFKHNVRNMSLTDMLRAVDRNTRIW